MSTLREDVLAVYELLKEGVDAGTLLEAYVLDARTENGKSSIDVKVVPNTLPQEITIDILIE